MRSRGLPATTPEPRGPDAPMSGDVLSAVRPPQGLTLALLVRLRWAALVSQALLVGLAFASGWLSGSVVILLLVAVGVLSNVALMAGLSRGAVADSNPLIGTVLVGDVVLLTAMLGITGGPSNPFTVLLLVYVTLAAVTLGPRWTWVVVASALVGYGSLFFVVPQSITQTNHLMATLPSHLAGMWFAFAASAASIAVFVTGVTRTLARRERELAALRLVAARDARLASLTTLAAGAAHELATPLASIAVAARELERLAASRALSDVAEDAGLISSQITRCRDILDQMSGRASQEWLEAPGPVHARDVVREVCDGLPVEQAGRLRVHGEGTVSLVTPRAGLVLALRNLVRNAFDASPQSGVVQLTVTASDDRVAFVVEDHGCGMPGDVLEHAGEPFFTTKPAGTGYGLGLFLVRLFAERQGGHLDIRSTSAEGTTVVLELARDGTNA